MILVQVVQGRKGKRNHKVCLVVVVVLDNKIPVAHSHNPEVDRLKPYEEGASGLVEVGGLG